MDRIFSLARTTLNHPLASFLRTIREFDRIRTDAARLDSLPRERLEDMGISPRTKANLRDSGQTGRMPQTPFW